MITLNGTPLDADGLTLAALLGQQGYRIERIVVERNLVIVPKADYESTILADGDTLEVVSFVGGG